MSKSLWDIPTIDEDFNATDNIFNIINEQISYLESETNNKIYAKFGRINMVGAAITAAFIKDSIGRGIAREYVEGESTDNLINANELYGNKRFAFELYNDKYVYRIFSLTISPMYPVHAFLDEDLYEELFNGLSNNPIQNGVEIISDDALESFLKDVFTCRKVKYIIQKMLKMAADTVE